MVQKLLQSLKKKQKKKFAFELRVNDKSYVLHADTEQDYFGWTDALKAAATRPTPETMQRLSGIILPPSPLVTPQTTPRQFQVNNESADQKSATTISEQKEEEKVSLIVRGLICEKCEVQVKNVLKTFPEIKKFNIDLNEERVVITGRQISVDRIIEAFEEANFLVDME